ncbi:MAG: hopanoid biosynthesis-associated protein HpnK [Chloroflexi bacterium]|nr:hopanoid biosynthesis-associated protein HpnK [Chloroflexota bacterium]
MQLIINADDFGRSHHINEAVILAHREGLVTSASLMVTGEAVEEAVALAGEHPRLAVGLHLVVVAGQAALPPPEIPHLVDERGRFTDAPLTAGLRYAFSRPARVELGREIAAQFERFASTGLPLSHVDGHLHMHLHPALWEPVFTLAARYGAKGIRIPHDELCLSLRHDRRHLGLKVGWTLAFALLNGPARRQAHRMGLRTVERVYGLLQSGHMDESYLLDVVQRLQTTTAEVYLHPNMVREHDLGPNPDDLRAALSTRVRAALSARGIQLTTYANLA